MLSKTIQAKLLEQVKNEWESEFIYLGMMAWCFNNNYDGIGNWLYNQANEEREHGFRILRYLIESDGDISIPSIAVPKANIKDLESIFEAVLKHEQKVTKMIHTLVDLSLKEKDHATNAFLQWFVTEQMEEEASARDILNKIQRTQGSPGALYLMEQKIGNLRPGRLPGGPAEG